MKPRWTKQQNARLLDLCAAGVDRSVIAGELGRTPRAVNEHARRLGVRFGVRINRAWTMREYRDAVELRLLGHSYGTIAGALKRNRGSVYNRLKGVS
jgi:DNA-binding CsgD family transcriptional regulator